MARADLGLSREGGGGGHHEDHKFSGGLGHASLANFERFLSPFPPKLGEGPDSPFYPLGSATEW